MDRYLQLLSLLLIKYSPLHLCLSLHPNEPSSSRKTITKFLMDRCLVISVVFAAHTKLVCEGYSFDMSFVVNYSAGSSYIAYIRKGSIQWIKNFQYSGEWMNKKIIKAIENSDDMKIIEAIREKVGIIEKKSDQNEPEDVDSIWNNFEIFKRLLKYKENLFNKCNTFCEAEERSYVRIRKNLALGFDEIHLIGLEDINKGEKSLYETTFEFFPGEFYMTEEYGYVERINKSVLLPRKVISLFESDKIVVLDDSTRDLPYVFGILTDYLFKRRNDEKIKGIAVILIGGCMFNIFVKDAYNNHMIALEVEDELDLEHPFFDKEGDAAFKGFKNLVDQGLFEEASVTLDEYRESGADVLDHKEIIL